MCWRDAGEGWLSCCLLIDGDEGVRRRRNLPLAGSLPVDAGGVWLRCQRGTRRKRCGPQLPHLADRKTFPTFGRWKCRGEERDEGRWGRGLSACV